jgi:4-azaleucine resistance transporter AzlC
MNTRVLKSALNKTMPVMFGYVPMGMAFGVLFSELEYDWYYATLMGVVIFAGAAQFMAVGLLAAGAGMLEVAMTTLLLNSRHIFYGLSLLKEFKVKGWRRWYLIFGLTDETYSLLTSLKQTKDKEERGCDHDSGSLSEEQLTITCLNQSYWVLGCTLGALLGELLGKNGSFDTQGLEFTLTALFMVLVIEQYKAVRTLAPFLIAITCGAIALYFAQPQNMLLVSLSLTLALLLMKYRLKPWT